MKAEEIVVGTPVIYWDVIKDDGQMYGPLKTEITSELWTLGHGDIVCKVKGKSGGVLISHLMPITAGSLMAAKLKGLKEITEEDIKDSTKKFFEDNGVNIEMK